MENETIIIPLPAGKTKKEYFEMFSEKIGYTGTILEPELKEQIFIDAIKADNFILGVNPERIVILDKVPNVNGKVTVAYKELVDIPNPTTKEEFGMRGFGAMVKSILLETVKFQAAKDLTEQIKTAQNEAVNAIDFEGLAVS